MPAISARRLGIRESRKRYGKTGAIVLDFNVRVDQGAINELVNRAGLRWEPRARRAVKRFARLELPRGETGRLIRSANTKWDSVRLTGQYGLSVEYAAYVAEVRRKWPSRRLVRIVENAFIRALNYEGRQIR